MRKLFAISFLLFSFAAKAQEQTTYAGNINQAFLKKHLTVIASAEMEGRETGTAGERKAAAYIEDYFKALGLTTAPGLNGYQQYFPLHKDSLKSAELEIDGKEASFGKDYISPAAMNETGKFKSDNIVFVGYGIEDEAYSDYKNVDVKGKTVIFFSGEPKADGKSLIPGGARGSQWTFPGLPKKLEVAKKNGAVGAFVITPSMAEFSERAITGSRRTNVYYPRENSATLNFASLSHAFGASILGGKAEELMKKAKDGASFTAGDYFTIGKKAELKIKRDREIIRSSNVVGVLEGSDRKDEYVFLTAHYDHVGIRDGKIHYGADDDGSGTVGVMAMAEAFAKAKKEGKGPRRTIIFMLFSGEEKGLWGSEYYSENPFYPLDKTTVNLNTDMVGRIDTERMSADTQNYVYVIGHDKISSELQPISEGANKKYTNLVFDYKFDDPKDPHRIYFRSDHYNFARKGVPVLFFYDGMLKADYHKPTDTVDKINWELYEKRVKMIFHTAWEMANRDAMLKRDTPLNMGER